VFLFIKIECQYISKSYFIVQDIYVTNMTIMHNLSSSTYFDGKLTLCRLSQTITIQRLPK